MVVIREASLEDAEEILALQKLAYQSEARLYDDWTLPPLMQAIESLQEEFGRSIILKAAAGERIVGSVRAQCKDDVCAVGRLIVHPSFQRQGIGSRLLEAIEARCAAAAGFELFTGSKSVGNIRLYQRHGYVITRTQPLSANVSLVFMRKPGRTPT
ncbi:MAG TPA: GNAT family N-acetyltransferase [Candidatus Hydrogenedentes bacterium]|nr:GNAT family N-acetyltransferase [Candidatus Hydrogenedentota bacterium]HPG66422.1 GNAT family N-acetyltransferase [Candidatus Hydrogenedentota bacterium]